MATDLFVPVAAVPLKGPQLSLLSSSVAPSSDGDDFALGEDTLRLLPEELQVELEARQGDSWTRGLAYLPENEAAATTRDPADTTTVDSPDTPPNLARVYYQPFLVSTKFTASSFGFPQIDFKGRAQRQNDVALPSAIEAEFWDGTLAKAKSWPNNYLTNITNVSQNLTPGATTIDNGTAVSVTAGLGILQDALRQGVGGQGMLHMIPRAVPSLLNVRRVGGFLLDIFDNIVVPGVGYSGNGPGGAVPALGTTWMYATDLVMTRVERVARVTPDTMAEALDRGQNGEPNTFTFRAQRYAAAYFDGARQYAVLVNLPS